MAQAWQLTKTATHPRMAKPVVHKGVLVGPLNTVIKRLKVTSRQRYELRVHRKTAFQDERGGTITLELLPFDLARHMRPTLWTRLKSACIAFGRAIRAPRGF